MKQLIDDYDLCQYNKFGKVLENTTRKQHLIQKNCQQIEVI